MLLRQSARHINRLRINTLSIDGISLKLQNFKRLNINNRTTSVRYFSANVNNSSSTTNINAVQDAVSQTGISDTLTDVAAAVVVESAQMGWAPKYYIMQFIDYVHIMADLPYWQSIVVVSLITRILLLPVSIKTAQNAARLAYVRPIMQKLQDAFKNNPNSHDPKEQLAYQKELKAVFQTNKVNPFMSFLLPLFQLPIFMSFFFALQEMGKYFPGYASGGAYWFLDLSAADATMVFPILNGLTFLLMIEVGSDGMPQNDTKDTFKMAMRGLSIVMVPMTMYMPQVSGSDNECVKSIEV